MKNTVDILMITYNRPRYTDMALQRLLNSCDSTMNVWVWHNGTDSETLRTVEKHLGHERLYQFHHSPQNKKLTEPTNWLWRESNAEFFSKVDDDSLVPDGWAQKLRSAMLMDSRVGCLCCWRFLPEDFAPNLAMRKIFQLNGGVRILMNPWVEGSGYLLRRQCVDEEGLLGEGESFPNYLIRTAWRGWINGWVYPFIYSTHLDDPRVDECAFSDDKTFQENAPLTAARNQVKSLHEWEALLRRSALHVQSTSNRPGRLFHVRSLLYKMGLRKLAKI